MYHNVISSRSMFIVRGCPGSGKSTVVKNTIALLEKDSCVVCNCDDFFMVDGKYRFDISKLRKAHSLCQEKARVACASNVEHVFIDNTNTTIKEMLPYIKTAIDHEYEIEVIEPSTSWALDVDELFKRNTHNVPKETIERMVARYTPHEQVVSFIQHLMPTAKDGFPDEVLPTE